MAGEWIKVEAGTTNKPEILKVARITGLDKDAVLGKLFRLWVWFDSNSVDGVVDGVVSTDVDALVGHEGFCSALQSVSWLDFDDDAETVCLPNFDRHNGETAKKRALKNKRQSRWRQKVDEAVDDPPSTSASTREEKRREDSNRGKFEKPPLDECKVYFSEKGFSEIEAEKFWNFYESKGWYVGKNKMKSWRHSAANWCVGKKPEAVETEVWK